ncbi:MlaD family protein [Conexibacter sp. SYSU D00693]|uniref:MlaD family protein n=1 Tax=Conexibacter sp. SYSU D00693 TaxID=2812560 RepID=UPI00196B1B7D|nr:MlaD family protein [Conexibacter sp. SYSU D00693]
MTVSQARRKLVVLAAFLAVCVAVFAYLFTIAGAKLPFSGEDYTVRTVVPDPFQLVPNGDVRLAGVKVGTVERITPRGGAGVVEIAVDPDYAPIHRDARVRVRTKTLVGENYLDLEPGSPRAGDLPDGGTLPLDQADEAVQLDKILSSFDRRTRAEVRRNLDGLGTALRGRGEDANALFGALNPTVEQGATVMGVLRRQRAAFARVVQRTGQVLDVFGQRTEAVRALATQARRAAQAASSRDRELGETIDALPATLRQARTTSGDLARFSRRATPVLGDLRRATTDLEPVVRDLGPAAVDARRLFARLPRFIDRANPLLDALAPFADRTRTAVPRLDGALRELNPLVGHLAPYSKELGAFFAAVGSTTAAKDGVSNYLRVQQVYSPTSLAAQTPELQAALKALTSAGALAPFVGEGRNAYPRPGAITRPRDFTGEVPVLSRQPRR